MPLKTSNLPKNNSGGDRQQRKSEYNKMGKGIEPRTFGEQEKTFILFSLHSLINVSSVKEEAMQDWSESRLCPCFQYRTDSHWNLLLPAEDLLLFLLATQQLLPQSLAAQFGFETGGVYLSLFCQWRRLGLQMSKDIPKCSFRNILFSFINLLFLRVCEVRVKLTLFT